MTFSRDESSFDISVLENSSKLLSLARASGCTIIHAPISFEPGHDEISESCYGILAGVKEGSAFTKGEWGSDFAGTWTLQLVEEARASRNFGIPRKLFSHLLSFIYPASMMPQKGDLVVKGKSGLCSFASKYIFETLKFIAFDISLRHVD